MKKILFLLLCIFIECSMGPLGGSGSQTTNGVTVATASNAITINADSGLTVLVFSEGYFPFNDDGYSDSIILPDSFHVFNSLQNGNYTVLVKRNDGKTVIFQNVSVDSLHEFRKTDSLQITGTISGSVNRPDSLSLPDYLIFIKGTPFCNRTGTQGKFKIDSVPLGTYNLSVRKVLDGGTDTLVETGKDSTDIVTISQEKPNLIINFKY